MMEESVEAPLIVTHLEAGNSVSYKRLKLLAAQLHDLKMDWEDLSENATADNTEMDQFKALIEELEALTAQPGTGNVEVLASMEQEDTEAEDELGKDFVSKIRAAFDMPEEVISKESAPLWKRVNFDELNSLLESLRESRRNSKEHAADLSNGYSSNHHNTERQFLQIAHESLQQANDECKQSQIQMLQSELDTERELRELQNQLAASQNELDALLLATER